VDINALKVTTQYDLAGRGREPAGLGLDQKNGILFAFCHDPATAVILNADNGEIIATLPIGKGTDGGGFNPNTMEAFSSQSDGTLTIIKENSPTSFKVEQTVHTKPRAKTCTLDTRNNHIITATIEAPPGSTAAPAASAEEKSGEGKKRGGRNDGPGLLDILVVGRQSNPEAPTRVPPGRPELIKKPEP
jgi:hypothetical protein